MARSSTTALRAAGVVLIAAGAGLGAWGYQESHELGNELVAAIMGRITDEVLAAYAGAAACLAVGLVLVLWRWRR